MIFAKFVIINHLVFYIELKMNLVKHIKALFYRTFSNFSIIHTIYTIYEKEGKANRLRHIMIIILQS